jgi:7,8-didemethyl-8-hydroxy-5-deazariboflavin synthase CofG subunit
MPDRIVTFSKNVFIPLTNACRNKCSYCGFRSKNPFIIEREAVLELLRRGARQGCKEALFTFGEEPGVYPEIKDKLESWGYSTVLEYLYDLCADAVELGLLPHSNPGSISRGDLKILAKVNASMGLMLESSSERLCKPGMPHGKSPGKNPSTRLRVLKEAGRLKIPFTTGILIGIGESAFEVEESLKAVREIHDRYGNIQEIIIQNFRPKPNTLMVDHPEPGLDRILHALEFAKQIFPETGLQVPPNLNPGREGLFLERGANDFGGVSPVTPDFINPLDSWPAIAHLRRVALQSGFTLRERLPVYPRFIEFAPERLRSIIDSYVGRDGLVI